MNWNIVTSTITDTIAITSRPTPPRIRRARRRPAASLDFTITLNRAGLRRSPADRQGIGRQRDQRARAPTSVAHAGADRAARDSCPRRNGGSGDDSVARRERRRLRPAGTAIDRDGQRRHANVGIPDQHGRWTRWPSCIVGSRYGHGLPSNTALVAGTKVFSVTLKTAVVEYIHGHGRDQRNDRREHQCGDHGRHRCRSRKLQILVPGETAALGSSTGKTGTPPSAETSAVPFNVIVNAVDANWNVVGTINDTVSITSSDVNATLPGSAVLVSGTRMFSVTLNTAGNRTVTATDTTTGTTSASISPSITVVSGGSAVKLQLLVPGETAAPGTASGKTGTPSARTAGTAFSVTVNAVDSNWNVVNTVTDVVTITTTNSSATLPGPDAALVAGTESVERDAEDGRFFHADRDRHDQRIVMANTSPAFAVNANTSALLSATAGASAGDHGWRGVRDGAQGEGHGQFQQPKIRERGRHVHRARRRGERDARKRHRDHQRKHGRQRHGDGPAPSPPMPPRAGRSR